MEEYKYKLLLTERQAKLLSYACDRLMRMICGQDWSFQDLMENAWEKRAKEATGKMMPKDWDGGWWAMRHDAEKASKDLKMRFWGLESNAMYGIHYDDTADILFDIHRVLRHQLWLDDEKRLEGTVDSEFPTSGIGSEPLCGIDKIG